ncbi:MAG TPA: hypothetical protein VGE24_02420, partial [Emticicia sp.]
MATYKKSKKATQPLTKPFYTKKQPPQPFTMRLLKILFVVILGIVLALGIMARIYHYNKYE